MLRKWLRRLIVLLVVVLVAIAAAFYILYFRRTPLPPAASHARVVPVISSVSGLTVCWVETANAFSDFPFGATAGSILVRHPAGSLLIDTGNSSHFDDEISAFPLPVRFKLKSLAGELIPDVPLQELLRLVGEDPGKLRWVILSHAHLDHAGGLMDLPRVPVLLTREELQFAAAPHVQATGYVIARHVQRFPPVDAPTLNFSPQPYETFEESADLYGDCSVVAVPLRGHTPGSVGVFVNFAPRWRMFYVGDAVDDERGFAKRVGKPLILRDTDDDEPLANEIVARLSDLHQKVPELAIIPAHGRSAYLKFFPGGPLSCVSNR